MVVQDWRIVENHCHFLKKTKKIKLHLKDDATARENSEGAILEDIDFTFCSGIDNIMFVVCL